MSDYYYIKYGGVTVDNASGISHQQLIKAKDSFMFQVPNFYNENFETWEARINGDIELWDSTGADTLKCKGYVDSVIGTNPLTITCYGDMGKLAWWMITEEQSKLYYHKLYVNGTPPTSGDKYFKGQPYPQAYYEHDFGDWTSSGASTWRSNVDHGVSIYMSDNGDYINRTGLDSSGHSIEFYINCGDASADFEVLFEKANSDQCFKFFSDSGNFRFQSGAANTNCGAIVGGTWYHIDIVWRVSVDEVDCDVDSVSKVSAEAFINNGNVDEIKFIRTDATNSVHLDGIGYSGDTEYTYGDNNTAYYPELQLLDVDGNDPNLTDDTYDHDDTLPKYAIISDNTLSTNEKADNLSTANSNSSGENTETNTHAATHSSDGAFWELTNLDPTVDQLKVWLAIDLEDENILDSSYITNIKIELDGKIGVKAGETKPIVFDIYWSANSTLNTSTDVLLASVSKKNTGALWKYQGFGFSKSRPFILSEADNDNETYFIKAVGEWTEGYLFIYQRELYNGDARIYIDHFSVDIEYETATFDQINMKILAL